jgi:hypothetical protein
VKLPKKSTVFWSGYVATGILADGYFLRKQMFEDTLTHNGRRAAGIHPEAHPIRRRVGQAVIIGFCIWVANHFAFGPHSDGRIHRFVVDGLAGKRQADA